MQRPGVPVLSEMRDRQLPARILANAPRRNGLTSISRPRYSKGIMTFRVSGTRPEPT